MNKPKTIAIICAMSKEVQTVMELLGEVTLIEVEGILFYQGKYLNHRIILCQCGIGKVNAAITTTLLIREFKPDYLINSGVAGGYDCSLKTLDVVVGSQMFYYDVDVTFNSFNLRYGQMQDEPFLFSSDENLVKILSDNKIKINVKVGLIATADSFQTNRSYLDDLVKKYFGDLTILAVDMESTAIAHVCHKLKVPFVIIRSISDVVGVNQEQVYDNFLERACHNSSLVVQELLEKV